MLTSGVGNLIRDGEIVIKRGEGHRLFLSKGSRLIAVTLIADTDILLNLRYRLVTIGDRLFSVVMQRTWNSLPDAVSSVWSLSSFNKQWPN